MCGNHVLPSNAVGLNMHVEGGDNIYPMLDLCLSHRTSRSTRITENKSSGTGGSSLSNSCYLVSISCWRSNSM
jgi:hypothetical protein